MFKISNNIFLSQIHLLPQFLSDPLIYSLPATLCSLFVKSISLHLRCPNIVCPSTAVESTYLGRKCFKNLTLPFLVAIIYQSFSLLEWNFRVIFLFMLGFPLASACSNFVHIPKSTVSQIHYCAQKTVSL